MHRLLHGIRRASCRPVVSPLVLARLQPLLSIQPFGDGDLLPQSGDEDADGDLLPLSGEEDKHGDGDLLPQSGDDADGEGIPPSQGNESAKSCASQPPISKRFRNDLGIYLLESSGVDAEFVAAWNEESAWFASLCKHGHFIKIFAPTDVMRNVGLPLFRMYVFDPGGLLNPHEEVPLACYLPAVTTTIYSIFAADQVHPVYVGDSADYSFYELLFMAIMQDDLGPCKDDAALYGYSLWLYGNSSKEGAAIYFLIPLRGSNNVQWNDEALDENVAALKTKTMRRKKVLQLFYLTKDLLDSR